MKSNSMSKAFLWVLIASLFRCPTLNAFQEGIVTDDFQDFPTLNIIEGLNQDKTPFSMRVKHTLYDIGEKVWLVSQKNQMDNAVNRLHDFDQPEFQEAIAAMMNFHAMLDDAYAQGIPQTEASLYSALRNREYADRFALPAIGAIGVGAGYGSAVVRSRMMSKFIEMLALSGLGIASSKLEKAALYTLIGILTTALLGSIFYHWKKYNKLYTEKQKQKLELKLTTKYDKKIRDIEHNRLTELENLGKQITKNERDQNKKIVTISREVTKKLTAVQKAQSKQDEKLMHFQQNFSGQLHLTMANQNELQNQLQAMIEGQNHVIETVNQAWGAIALANFAGTERIDQEQLAQFRSAGTEALRQFDKHIQESNKRHNKILHKFKSIVRRKKSKPTSPLLPLSPPNELNHPPRSEMSSSSPTNNLAPTLIISVAGNTDTE